MTKKTVLVVYKLLLMAILGCNYAKPAYAADFSFTVPINFALSCNISMAIYATCAVFEGEPAEWGTDDWDGWLRHEAGHDYYAENIIGGNRPFYIGQGSGHTATVIYPGNGSPVNTLLQVKFNVRPDKNASSATHWKCWALMAPASLQGTDINMYGIPGSANDFYNAPEYGGGDEEADCYRSNKGNTVTVTQEGALPTN